MILGHRGWSKEYPENTLLAFQKALELGINGIEFDVQMTVDQIPVIIHDYILDRTTNGSGAISQTTYDQIRQFSASSLWLQYPTQPIPTLYDVFNLIANEFENRFYNIEIKLHDDNWRTIVDHLTGSLSDYAGSHELLISSFHHDCLKYFKNAIPDVKIGLLYEAEANEALKMALGMNAYSINLNYHFITESLIRACHDEGIHVCAWTVDQPDEIKKIASWGVDIIISNQPDIALEAVQSV